MNRTQMIKKAYVRGLAARGILRARMLQKQAAGGLKDYAISGGIGAAGGGALGSLIGALVQYARKKNVLRGALAGGGIGGGLGLLGGLGYQGLKDWRGKGTKTRELPANLDNPTDPGAILAAYPDMDPATAAFLANYNKGRGIDLPAGLESLPPDLNNPGSADALMASYPGMDPETAFTLSQYNRGISPNEVSLVTSGRTDKVESDAAQRKAKAEQTAANRAKKNQQKFRKAHGLPDDYDVESNYPGMNW